MTALRVRLSILAVFVGAMVVQLLATALVSGHMWPDELVKVVGRLLSIYAVHLALVLASIFARPKDRLPRMPAPLAWTALAMVVMWNALLVVRTISFSAASTDSVDDLLGYWDTVSSGSSFLVVGVLAFVFAREDPKPKAENPAKARK